MEKKLRLEIILYWVNGTNISCIPFLIHVTVLDVFVEMISIAGFIVLYLILSATGIQRTGMILYYRTFTGY